MAKNKNTETSIVTAPQEVRLSYLLKLELPDNVKIDLLFKTKAQALSIKSQLWEQSFKSIVVHTVVIE